MSSRNVGTRASTPRLASGTMILVDSNTAGWGWFIDPTPGKDREVTTPGSQGEKNQINLLTIRMVEMGHLVGQDHEGAGLMAETLAASTRLVPLKALDQVFADLADWDVWL